VIAYAFIIEREGKKERKQEKEIETKRKKKGEKNDRKQ